MSHNKSKETKRMKVQPHSITLLTACAALALVPARATAGENSGGYVHADLGVALAKSTTLREFPDAVPGGKIKFDPGGRLSLGGGYRFNDWLSAGGETGYLFNLVEDADIAVAQVPILGNVEFRLPNKTPLVPFIGGGPGVSISVITLDNERLNDGSRVDGSASDAVFAWQAYGGVRYKINDSISVGVVYKYFEAGAATWEVRNTSDDIRFGKARVHAISAAFSMSF
jgi:opacity protein-like surface antigen